MGQEWGDTFETVSEPMNAKVLIVEDEEALALLLQYNLEAEGFRVSLSQRGDEAEVVISEDPPDLIILDWMLPGLSGIELCRRLRTGKTARPIPILILTARGEEQDRIRGLTVGADDYVVKPFSVPELLARVRAILRRASPSRIAQTLEVDGIQLDREAYRVVRNGRQVRLGPTEFKLLEFLMESPGRVFTRTQLLDGVWGHDVYVDERTVDVHIGRLRKAINRGKEKDPIRTVRGAGYALGEKFPGQGLLE
jgi:two-component system, OmpR family, phosphate regulon response regulator PhoB